jgi:hypothetical protein
LRRLPKKPEDRDLNNIDKLQESIQARFLVLTNLQQGVSGMLDILDAEEEGPCTFDDIYEEVSPPDTLVASNLEHADIFQDGVLQSASASASPMVPIPPANQAAQAPPATWVPKMPSTCRVSDPHLQVVELGLRKRQAVKHLHRLREVIADKSFQHSHVIRVAPRTSIRTRARSTITSLQRKISFHSRIYNKCRSAMVRLGADGETLARFRVITKDDLKSSTALLNPNLPGSTKLQLSWIWNAWPTAAAEAPQALQECM